jgi:hypothetical protein
MFAGVIFVVCSISSFFSMSPTDRSLAHLSILKLVDEQMNLDVCH